MLAQWIVVGIEAVIVSHRAQDLSASAKSAEEGNIPDQRGNARGHDDLVSARAANRSPQAVIQCGDAVDPLGRSEEHTSELQSLMRISYAVFCLKKKKNTPVRITTLIE